MVTAKFISARALKDGTITYTLTGEGGKDALRAAVDLQGEECVIELNTPKDMTTLEALYHEYRDAIQFMEGLKAKAYEKGINDEAKARQEKAEALAGEQK